MLGADSAGGRDAAVTQPTQAGGRRPRHLSNARFELLWWLFAVAFTLHNVEEVVTRPRWFEGAGDLPGRAISDGQFGLAAGVLTVLAWVGVVWAARSPRRSLAAHVMGGMAGVLAVNVVFPHLVLSAATWSYSPGLVTAVLLDAPICAAILVRGIREGRMDARRLSVSIVVVGAVTVMLVALLFRLA